MKGFTLIALENKRTKNVREIDRKFEKKKTQFIYVTQEIVEILKTKISI